MTIPLLTTKLYIPPLHPNLVSRPRLIGQLKEGLQLGHRLTLVSAPAGFGKTTLLSVWVGTCGRPVAWVSLDKGDNDLARFLAYFIAALQTIEANIGEGILSALQSPQPPPLELVLTALINEITAVPTPFLFVLDDYHAIEAQSIHDALTFVLDHLPPQAHLIIATRADPSLPLSRLRARGQMVEIRADDLRFTADETTTLLNEVMRLNLSSAYVHMLETRTEGWITGLQLAALSMQRHQDIDSFILDLTGSHRYILDYLADEVVSLQSQEVKRFLRQTSILTRLSGPLCDAVTQRDNSQDILESLDAANLFIIPLDDERCWYRYHHLFADLLRHRLVQTQSDDVPALHRRASAWYEQHGVIAEAVAHALAAEDFERTASLIEQNAWKMLTRGEITTLLGWLEALPDDLVRARPRIRVFYAWTLALRGQRDAVEFRLQDTNTQEIQGEVAALRAYVAGQRGDETCAIELSRRALELLPEQDWLLRSIMAINLGTVAYWTAGDPVAASPALTEAISLSQTAGEPHLTQIATSTLGHVQIMMGRLHLAAETYQQALQLTTAKSGRPSPFAGLVYLGMAELLYEWNDLEGAKGHAMQGIELGERGGSIDVLQGGYSYTTLARVYQAQGDVDSALEMLQKAEALARRYGQTYVIGVAAALRARLWVAQGNIAAAANWVQDSSVQFGLGPSGDVDEKLSYKHEIEHITLARVRIAQGEASAATRLLARLLETAETAGRIGRVIEILALQAVAFHAQGDMDQAVAVLAQALSLAEPEGYVRTFVDEGEPIARLLLHILVTQQKGDRTLPQGIALNYVTRLLAAFGQQVELSSPGMDSLLEPLSERELEVLRLIVAGLSNPEIAEELVIAVSTVKSHVNHIFGKLGVESRTRAAARAQELGLL